ncbi:MAG: M20/M25/M40 family metallo-hydrolase, partial [Acidobacteria bacterium]|nr:M20/M25/M40 family metallo-hydrolase [Acidobacteriota bacterium]
AVPRLDNPITHLAAAVAKLGQLQAPMRLNETSRTFFQRMAELSTAEEAFLFTHIEDPAIGPMVQEAIRRKFPRFNSMLRTSISPTMINGGFRSTVVPAEAEATLDVRAMPDEDMDAFVAWLKEVIDDPAVEIVRIPAVRPAAQPSRLDTEMFRAMERTQALVYPGAVTIPMMLAGATDMAQLRSKGVQAYGVASPGDEQDPSSHSNDERISINGLGKMIEFMYRTVVDVAAAPRSR